MDAVVEAGRLLDAVRVLRDNHWGYLAAITGLDHPAAAAPATGPVIVEPAEGKIEALYHFCEGAAVGTLRVTVPYGEAVVPSICGIIPSARLYEIELSEMFGVTVDGLGPKHLLLPDSWPEGLYPLRKSFSGERVMAPAMPE